MPRGGARSRSGPPPMPTALKVLHGNPGRRPLNDLEPKPEAAMPRCPPELSEYAHKEWRRIIKELHKLGLMTALDRGALAGYCAAYGDFIEAEARIRKAGNLVNREGHVHLSPLFRMRNIALELMHRYLTEFGMTPASRSRIRAGDVQKAVDELPSDEAFLQARGLRVIK